MLSRKGWWGAGIGFIVGAVLSRMLPRPWPSWYEVVVVLGVFLAAFVIERLKPSSRRTRGPE
jgi:uncharacterized membrane protein YfcA